ncbi:tetratricopeptide repeat protein [Candidatus Tisiphia endosymbiont of Oplodontha viridula]|uniref:tetratricopeptide repeat protein n=1 Tax=Candidatus Tisiphia endosymbiont of Oplodontha viridula TaxID=3077925 RepID=UPI0035C8814D
MQEFVNWEHNGHVIFASQDSELLPNIVKMTAFNKDDAITLANNILEKNDPKLAEFLVREFVCNVVYFLAKAYISLGRTQKAEENIQIVENMFNKELVNSPDVVNLYYAKTSLFFMQGKYKEALEQVNNTIKKHIEGGVQANDIYLVGPYMSRSEILNSLGKYNEAYEQSQQLYDMHKSVKKEDHEVFARIYTQMSRAILGLGNTQEALEYAQKAITIFIQNPSRPNKNLTISPDIDLAKAFVAEGDALAALGQNEKAVQSYLTAEMLYWNNYKDNVKNVDEVSRMYLAAAKATCHLAEKSWYIKFHDQHINKFGLDHPKSVEILKMDSTCYPKSQR